MATSTTRLSLYKPGGGSTGLILPDEIADIDKINGNMDLIDAAIGAKNVTSTTRPAVPFDGQIIRESDTLNTMIYSLAAVRWVPVGTPNAASSALRDALFPSPIAGNQVFRTDTSTVEVYYTAWVRSDGIIVPTLLSNCTVSANGVITVTAQPTFSFDCGPGWLGVRIESTDIAGSTGSDLLMQLRNAALASLTTGYASSGIQSAAGAAPTGIAGTANSWVMGRISSLGPGRIKVVVSNGAASAVKNFDSISSDSDNISRFVAGRNTTATPQTGITIFASAGTITGTFRVTGY